MIVCHSSILPPSTGAKDSKSSEATALQLLTLHVSMQLLSPDSQTQVAAVDIVADLKEIVNERFEKNRRSKQAERNVPDHPHWVEVRFA